MFLNGISFGICLLSLSFIILYKGEQIHSKLAIAITAILGWLVSGVLWLDINEYTAKIYVSSLPIIFFALLPLIYWYQGSLIAKQDWYLSKQTLKHFIPTAASIPLSLSLLLMPLRDFNTLFFEEPDTLTTWSTVNAAFFGLMVLIWMLLSTFYLILIVKRTATYHQNLKDIFANHANKKLHWFTFFVGWILVTWVYSCLVLVFENTLSNHYLNDTGVSVLLFVLIWFFCLHTLQRKPAFAEVMTSGQYERSSIDSLRLKRIANNIEQVVINQKAYLDPYINAVKLSEKLDVSTHYLSQTFTQEMNTTFYDYINVARIEAAKIDLKTTDKTVLDIAINVGFNTRSSFYNAFKKHTGITPSAFRSHY